MMPAALSQITVYSRECVRLLMPLYEAAALKNMAVADIPKIPGAAVLALGQSIEHDTEGISISIADLIAHLQIQHSRIDDLDDWISADDRSITKSNIVEFIVDALELYARAAMLFDYARRKTDKAPESPRRENLVNAAHACSIWDERAIYDAIERRFDP